MGVEPTLDQESWPSNRFEDGRTRVPTCSGMPQTGAREFKPRAFVLLAGLRWRGVFPVWQQIWQQVGRTAASQHLDGHMHRRDDAIIGGGRRQALMYGRLIKSQTRECYRFGRQASPSAVFISESVHLCWRCVAVLVARIRNFAG